jgi:glyoxylase-like metal-dependent hydrolase (beta-lactamase superfamily II)
MEPTDSIIPLAENLFWLKAPGRGKFPYCNGFLITGTETVMIDAGLGEKRIREIDSRQRIDRLVISHSHPDHILRWHLLKDRHLMMPQETPDEIGDLLQLGIRFTGTEEKGRQWREKVADGCGLKPMRLPDSRFSDGDLIDFGGIKLQAIHAPGHLNDHYCFFVPDSGILLSTDIDFDSFGPWYGNPESDIDLFKQSVQKVREYPFEWVCSSHKSPISKKDAQQAFDDYLAIFDRQQQLILDQCSEPKTVTTMVENSPIYHNKMPDRLVQMIFEENIIRKILTQLSRQGLVEEKNGIYTLAN